MYCMCCALHLFLLHIFMLIDFAHKLTSLMKSTVTKFLFFWPCYIFVSISCSFLNLATKVESLDIHIMKCVCVCVLKKLIHFSSGFEMEPLIPCNHSVLSELEFIRQTYKQNILLTKTKSNKHFNQEKLRVCCMIAFVM